MESLMIDNGSQFSCDECCQFVTTYKFEHTTSSPEYLQSNGLAERAVQRMKQMIKKCLRDGEEMYLANARTEKRTKRWTGITSTKTDGQKD